MACAALIIGWLCGGETNMNQAAVKLSLAVARSHHAMTPMSGTTILITGGLSLKERSLGSAELLDLDAGRSTVIATHLPRAGHAAVKLKDGRVLLIGGANDQHQVEARIEAFDPKSRTFSVIGGLASGGIHQQAVLLAGGEILVCGGMDAEGSSTNRAELFNTASGKSTALPNGMLRKRYNHQAVVLDNGLVLITGGAGDAESPRSAEIYDPAHRQFLSPIPMHQERAIHTATLLAGGSVFTFSNGVGEVFSSQAQRFDVVPGSAPPGVRDGHTATLLKDGRVLLLGGGMPEFSEDVLGAPVIYSPPGIYRELHLYNELVNRADHAALLLPNGDVLITGGRTVHAMASDAVVFYDPAANQFR